MQNNDFEKQVQQQLEDFSLLPADAVWQKVELRIQNERRRRRFLLWMFAAILLTGGATGFWLLKDNGNNEVASNTEKVENILGKNDKENKAKTDQSTVVKNDSNASSIEDDNRADNNKKLLTYKKIFAKTNPPAKTSKSVFSNDDQHAKTSMVTITEKKEAVIKNNVEKIIIDKAQTKDITANATEDVITKTSEIVQKTEDKSDMKTDDKPEIKTEITETTKAPLIAENKIVPVKNKPKQKTNALLFGVTLLGGISDNRTASLSMNKSAADAFASSPGPGTTQASIVFPRYNYSSSSSWGAGVFVQKSVLNKMAVTVGLNYHLMSSNISVGARVDSLRTFQDSVLNKSATVSSFYRAGEISEYRSKYHMLELPVNMLFQLNRNENKPFTLSAGLTAGYLMGSDVMYINNRARSFYEEKDHLKRFSFSGQTSFTFTLLNSAKYRIQAGPHVQYQFSNLTKSIINTNEHLLFFGLQGNLLFKTLNK